MLHGVCFLRCQVPEEEEKREAEEEEEEEEDAAEQLAPLGSASREKAAIFYAKTYSLQSVRFTFLTNREISFPSHQKQIKTNKGLKSVFLNNIFK